MRHSYNLVDEGFIPCVFPDGRRRELGLRETLASAHEIREIRDDSPLVTLALHRLLLAILHRNFGPDSLEAWARIWKGGRFDATALDDYFDRWHDRFDLCGQAHPFYQVRQMEPCKEVSTWRLALVQANNATLFDHRTEHDRPRLSPGQAARLLVSYQAWAIGGGVSSPFNFSHSPLVGESGFYVLILGETLFGTLWLNALCYDAGRPVPSSADDCPAWERDRLGQPVRAGTPIRGYLDYLTWQSRRIQLIPDGNGELTFSRMRMLQGHNTPAKLGPIEPMATYVQTKQGEWRAKSLEEGRSLWRDSHTLFQELSSTVRPPLAIHQLAELKARRLVDPDRVFAIAAFGLSSNRAKVSLWRQETLPLPLAYLADDDMLSALSAAIAAADSAARVLTSAVRRLAEIASQSVQGGRPDRDRVGQIADSLDCQSKYWARLERPFIVAGLEASPRFLQGVYRSGDRPGNWGALRLLNVRLKEIASKGDTS